jgi:threonine/homoserine/homoserine lactone efflux protein
MLKLAGAVYLGYLDTRRMIGRFRIGKPSAVFTAARSSQRLAAGAALKQGGLGNLLNPKAGVIFVSILPQFVLPGDTPLRLALMLLAFEAIILVWLNLYGYLISRAGQSQFGAGAQRTRERATGVVLIALGIRLAIERR